MMFLQHAQESNVCEEVQQSQNEYHDKIRVEEFCPHVHNSIKEVLLMI